MGEGKSSAAFSANQRAAFAGKALKVNETFACCPLSRRTGEGQGEGLLIEIENLETSWKTY
jgi:hypothetical protein